MERLVDMGLVKSIWMSNMTITKLEQVLPLCRIKPTVLEVEINPTFQQPKLFEYCKAHDILPIAFSPMGSPCRPERDTEEGDVVTFEMPELRKIAKAHNCHPALICMKWAVQRGHVPIPFSIYENEYVGNLRTVTEDFPDRGRDGNIKKSRPERKTDQRKSVPVGECKRLERYLGRGRRRK